MKSSNDTEEAELRYSQQLEICRGKINERMLTCEERLFSTQSGLSDMELSMFEGAVRGAMQWLARAVDDEVEELLESARQTAKRQLKQQQTVFDMKMATSRTAAAVSLQDQAQEMEAALHRKVEESLAAASISGGEVLAEAHQQIEELAAEVGTLKLKWSGTEEAMVVVKGLLSSSERSAAEWQTKAEDAAASAEKQLASVEATQGELTRCKDMLDAALVELEVKTQANLTLEQTVEEFLKESARLREESASAKTELTQALADLGIVTEENLTLSEQIQRLVQQAGEGESLRKERDAAREKGAMLQAALTRLDGEKAALQAQLDDARSEIDTMKARGAEAALAKSEARVAQLEAEAEEAAAEMARLAAELAEAKHMAGSGGQLLDEARATIARMQKVIDQAMTTLEAGFARLGLKSNHAPHAGCTEGEALDARVGALTSHCAQAMQKLEAALADLKASHASHAALEQKAARLQKESDASKQEARALAAERDELQAKCAALQKQVDAAGSGAMSATKQLALWKAEAQKLEAVVTLCCSKLDAALDPAAAAPTAAATCRSAAPVAAPAPAPAADEPAPSQRDALVEKAERLICAFEHVKRQLESMASALTDSQAALELLKTQLDSADGIGNAKMQKLQQEAKQQRAQLVTSALESLRHLRAHLVKAMSGLREVRPDGAGQPPLFSTQSEWQLESENVMRLELPTLILGNAIRSPKQSPRVLKGLSYDARPAPHRRRLSGDAILETGVHTAQPPHTARAALGRGPRAPARPVHADMLAPEPLGRNDAIPLAPNAPLGATPLATNSLSAPLQRRNIRPSTSNGDRDRVVDLRPGTRAGAWEHRASGARPGTPADAAWERSSESFPAKQPSSELREAQDDLREALAAFKEC